MRKIVNKLNYDPTINCVSSYPVGRFDFISLPAERRHTRVGGSAQPEFYRGEQCGRERSAKNGGAFRTDSRGVSAIAGGGRTASLSADYDFGGERRRHDEITAAGILGEKSRASGGHFRGPRQHVFRRRTAEHRRDQPLSHDFS